MTTEHRGADLMARVQSALDRSEQTWTPSSGGAQEIGVVVPHFLLTDVKAFVEWSRLETERLNAVIELYTKAVDRWQNEAVEAKSDLAAPAPSSLAGGEVERLIRNAFIAGRELSTSTTGAKDEADASQYASERLAALSPEASEEGEPIHTGETPSGEAALYRDLENGIRPLTAPRHEAPAEGAGELIKTIRTRLIGVSPDDQDVVLEDSDWLMIVAALEAAK